MKTTWRERPRAEVMGISVRYIFAGLIVGSLVVLMVLDLTYGAQLPIGPLLIVVPICLGMFISEVMRHRAWRKLRDADFLVCPVCEYRLHGLASAGYCPECGGAYDAQKVREHWNHMHEAAIKTAGCVRLSDRQMKTYIWVSIPLFAIAIVLFGAQHFANLVTGGIPLFFTLSFLALVIMVLPMLIGAAMCRQAKLRDSEMRKGKANADTDADSCGDR